MTKRAYDVHPVPSKDDYGIYVVADESEIEDPDFRDFFGWQKLIKHKRVIPYPALAEQAFVGKTKGKPFIEFWFTVGTGITLGYQGKEWREDTQIVVKLPLHLAQKLVLQTLKIAKRSERAYLRRMR